MVLFTRMRKIDSWSLIVTAQWYDVIVRPSVASMPFCGNIYVFMFFFYMKITSNRAASHFIKVKLLG